MTKRNYRREYDQYHAKPEQKKNRAGRNKARRYALKSGRVNKGDNREIDHKNFNPRDNRPENLRVLSKKANRSRQP
tara:strand:- start:582 stop:809 length:228 start_codon:yes stop_codon:yes gene_type:complete